MRYQSFAEFWPHYLREHAKPATRSFHYIGTALTMVVLGLALVRAQAWLLVLVPVAGYGFAWISHAFVERNRPATFTYPLWSLISDYRMFALGMTGRLVPELERAGVTLAGPAAPRSSPSQ